MNTFASENARLARERAAENARLARARAAEIARIRQQNRFCIDCGARTILEFRRGAMIGEDRWICRDPARCAARRLAR